MFARPDPCQPAPFPPPQVEHPAPLPPRVSLTPTDSSAGHRATARTVIPQHPQPPALPSVRARQPRPQAAAMLGVLIRRPPSRLPHGRYPAHPPGCRGGLRAATLFISQAKHHRSKGSESARDKALSQGSGCRQSWQQRRCPPPSWRAGTGAVPTLPTRSTRVLTPRAAPTQLQHRVCGRPQILGHLWPERALGATSRLGVGFALLRGTRGAAAPSPGAWRVERSPETTARGSGGSPQTGINHPGFPGGAAFPPHEP